MSTSELTFTNCTECGVGPFARIDSRPNPDLCIECGNHADRRANGWTPENSAD